MLSRILIYIFLCILCTIGIATIMNAPGLPNQAQLALSSGREISSNGRLYLNGSWYSLDLKLEVAITYQQRAIHALLGRPNLSEIARHHRVDFGFVKKIEEELWLYNRVLSPEEIRANADRPVGPGSIALCQYDFFIIMRLYWKDPSRGVKSYRDHLHLFTGKRVSEDTIRRVFEDGFLYKGTRIKPNLIPLDKFKPANVVSAYNFLTTVFTLTPEKIIFVDEKSFKAQEVVSKYVRRDPTTGIVPSMLVDSDFRNTVAALGFLSINRRKYHPLWYRIHTGSNNMEEFRDACLAAFEDGFFEEYDVVVADGASIHNDVEDMFWQVGKVLFIFLPTRTPEWNPIELIWQLSVVRLAKLPLDAIKRLREEEGGGKKVVIKAIQNEFDAITFDDAEKAYASCYSFFPQWRALRDRAMNL